MTKQISWGYRQRIMKLRVRGHVWYLSRRGIVHINLGRHWKKATRS